MAVRLKVVGRNGSSSEHRTDIQGKGEVVEMVRAQRMGVRRGMVKGRRCYGTPVALEL